MTIRRNKLGMAVSAAVFSVVLTACGGGGGGGNPPAPDDNWNEATGQIDNVHLYVDPGEPAPGCEVNPLNLIVKGDFYDEVAAYIYGSSELLGRWPGTAALRLDACPAASIYTVALPDGYDPAGVYNVRNCLKITCIS